ncbi:MAG: hypothetical protein VX405_08720 [Myxococcota bacterium]|jgi:hypothetical protein|nr:hypothetical protein [Myxococcota bacterium]
MVSFLFVAGLWASPQPPSLPVYPGSQRLAEMDIGVAWRQTYQANVPPNKVARWYSQLWQKPVQVIRGVTLVALVLEDLKDAERGVNEKIMVKGVELRPSRGKKTTIYTLVSGRMSEGKNLRSVDVKMPKIFKTLPLNLPIPTP